MTYICERCSEQFEERAKYTAHKKAHMRGEIPDKTVEELMGAEPVERVEPPNTPDREVVAEPLGKIPPTATEEWDNLVEISDTPYGVNAEPQPLNLVYHYEGDCAKCGTPVETLVLDDVIVWNKKPVKSKVAVVAWCPSCKKQLRLRQVAKL
jgi:hypothetical protein